MTTAIADAPRQPLTIRQQLQSPDLLKQIAMVVPQHMKPERMVRVALTALTRTPQLANCDQASFFRCLLDLSQWGLEPDGRHAHLIPFRNNKRGVTECQLIIDYKGLVQLAYRSGFVKSIHADIVRAGDLFVYNRGDVERHTPWFLRADADKPDVEGEMYAAYCRVELKDGAIKTEALSKAEVDSVRRRSKAGGSGPWVTDYAEMAKKTAFRRVSKWIPLSAEIVEAFERDDDRLDDSHVLDAVPRASGMAGLKQQLAGIPEQQNADGIDPPHTDADANQEPPDNEWVAVDDESDPSGLTAEERRDLAREAKGGKLFDTHQNVGQ